MVQDRRVVCEVLTNRRYVRWTHPSTFYITVDNRKSGI
jgi:hypothetical protein